MNQDSFHLSKEAGPNGEVIYDYEDKNIDQSMGINFFAEGPKGYNVSTWEGYKGYFIYYGVPLIFAILWIGSAFFIRR